MKKERIVKDLKTYYNFSSLKIGTLNSTIYTDLSKTIFVPFKDEIHTEINNIISNPEDKVITEPINFVKLLKKKKMIELNINDKCIRGEKEDIFCRRKKAKCNSCYEKTTYTLKQVQMLSKKYLIEELSNHKHPKNRIINSKQRNVQQAKKELMDHYVDVHFLKY